MTTIQLPPLHRGRDGKSGQVEIAEDSSRFKIIICGRRWGKTTYGVWECYRQGLLKSKQLIWWVAPSYKVAMPGWVMLRAIGNMIPGATVKEGDRFVVLPNGTEIWAKSADDPDSLRGEGLDLVVFDEPSQIRERTWPEVVRPALVDTKGRAIFIGTPKGKNWIWQLWQYAGRSSQWGRWKKPTIDNPYIDPAEIAEIKAQELPNIFKQEYEADFGASQLQVYDTFDRNSHLWKWETPKFIRFIGGLDFAGTTPGSHKSAGVFAGVTERDEIVELFEFEEFGARVTERQVEWMAESEALAKVLMTKMGYKPPSETIWRADKTQSAFIQMMRSNGFSIIPSKGGQGSVNAGIEMVQRRLQVRGDGRAKLYYSPSLTQFPEAMERYRFPDFVDDEFKPKSQNPLKVNDDLVDAIRYQVEGADLYTTGNPQELYGSALPTVT